MEPHLVAWQMVSIRKASSLSLFNRHLGIYKLYAVDILTLQDKPSFPVIIDGNFADNDNTRQVQVNYY